MPRLILIEGPQTGEFFQLGNENYLGKDQMALRFSRTSDLACKQALIHRAGNGYQIRRLDRGSNVLVNGEAIDAAGLNHGDLITLADAVMIFDSDTPEGEAAGMAMAAGGPGVPYAPGAGPAEDSVRIAAMQDPDSANLEGTMSIRRDELEAQAQIRYRQRQYQDPDSVIRGIEGPDTSRRLATLYKVSSAVAAILDLPKLLQTVLDLTFTELPADRGAILLFNAKEKKLRTMASKTRHGGEAPKISRTIVKEVLRTRESLLSLDAMQDDRFSMGMSIVDESIRSAMCVPLVNKDQVLGVIFVDTSEQTRAFSRKDLDLLTGIAMQASLAIENARLYKELGEKERLKAEVDLASSIQQGLLPKKLPRSREIEVYGRMIPAKEVGGDYFDFHINREAGILNIIVGDVTGKGVSAGIVMAMARSYLRPLCNIYTSPKKIMAEANKYLYEDTNRGMFMSALLMAWNERQRKFVYTGCGHEHILVYRAQTRKAEAIRAGGMALGLMKDCEKALKDEDLVLGPGDTIVLYTDGVTEARNPESQFFTLENLHRCVEAYGHLSAKDLLEAILWEVKSFMGNAEQFDDITLVTVKKR